MKWHFQHGLLSPFKLWSEQRCCFVVISEGKGGPQGHVDKGNKETKTKQKTQKHGSEGTPNYIDTLYIARVIVTIIQAGTYCTELKLYGFKKLVYVLSGY